MITVLMGLLKWAFIKEEPRAREREGERRFDQAIKTLAQLKCCMFWLENCLVWGGKERKKPLMLQLMS